MEQVVMEDIMIKINKMILLILSILFLGMVCFILIIYTPKFQSQAKNPELYGTYQFNIRDLDHTEYLAAIPPLKGDADKRRGQFQWYDIDNNMLHEGICKIRKGNFITFYENDHSIATIFFADGKYYFVDSSLEPQVITKTSDEPMVAVPIE